MPITFDAATPIVLILNEVLSNTVKHAFPDGRTGEVRIGLRRSGGRLMLQVRDNGIGLPPTRIEQMNSSMGLRLVSALARQLGAKASFKSEKGTVFTLSIPGSVIETSQSRMSNNREPIGR
jgi:two-component sensor histidine kinase